VHYGVGGWSIRVLTEKGNSCPAAYEKYFPSKRTFLLVIQAEGWSLAVKVHSQVIEGALTIPVQLLAGGARTPRHHPGIGVLFLHLPVGGRLDRGDFSPHVGIAGRLTRRAV